MPSTEARPGGAEERVITLLCIVVAASSSSMSCFGFVVVVVVLSGRTAVVYSKGAVGRFEVVILVSIFLGEGKECRR